MKTCAPGGYWCNLWPLMRDVDWKGMPVIMMDFEGSASSGVVEFGVVCLQAGSIQRIETALCQPTGRILSRDRGVHGISEAQARDMKLFSSYYELFVSYRRTGVFAAHNKHAENSFIKDTWAVPPGVPDWRRGEGTAQEWGPWIDTLSIYRALYPGLESYGLGNLVDVFDVRRELEEIATRYCPENRCQAHCALFDALASALLLIRLESEKDLHGLITMGWLLQLSQETSSQTELF